MPAVVLPAVVSAVASGFSITAAGIAFNLTASSFLTAFATSLVLGGISRAFAPDKPKFDIGSSSFSNVKSGGVTQQVRQPISEHRLLYGQARVSGPMVFASTTDDNKYLHTVIVLAAHEIEAIDEVWINDVSIAVDGVDGNGLVNDGGTYDGLVRIKKHLGTDSQTADSNLVGEVTEWTNDHRGRGRAYIYVRYEFDQDTFNKIPNASAYVRGKKVYDTRDTNTKFTLNPALCTRDYLLSEAYGFGEDSGNVDDTFTDSAANECEEIVDTANLDTTVSAVDDSTDIITLSVTEDILPLQLGDRVEVTTTGTAPAGLSTGTNYYVIPYQFKDNPRIKLASSYANALSYTAIDITDAGTGTHTIRKNGEPRYAASGIVDTAVEVEDNLKDLLSAMGGQAIYAGGEWRIKAAAYESPTVTIDEDDIIGPVKINTKVSRKDRFNRVKGVYVSPLNLGQPADYPPVVNSTYATHDGEVITKSYDLPMTQRPHTAQRLAKIELEKSRQEITATLICNLRAMQVQAGDTIMVTNTRMGWSSKVFEIIEWKFVTAAGEGAPQLAVQLLVRETASAIYDWNSGEETGVDPAPNSSLPNPFVVANPTGVTVSTKSYLTDTNTTISRILIEWTAAADAFVTRGGRYELQFKRSSESDWEPSWFVDGELEMSSTPPVEDAVNYDIRIRSVNAAGVKASTWQEIFGYTVGASGAGATNQLDYRFISEAATVFVDRGSITATVNKNLDYGTLT